MGSQAAKSSDVEPFYAATVETALGPILLVADQAALHILEFSGEERADMEANRHEKRTGVPIVPGSTPILDQAARELEAYFAGRSASFETPIAFWGTDFQQSVWRALLTIPVGETWSYKQLAVAVDNPPGVRAVAQANGANQLAIIVPCHRVIQSDGKLGGYGGQIWRKQWLLDHERTHFGVPEGQLI